MGIVYVNVSPDPTNQPCENTATNPEPKAKSANGRSREAFNAYQREYMRKRRAALKQAPHGNPA